MRERFGEAYDAYAQQTARFVPHLRTNSSEAPGW